MILVTGGTGLLGSHLLFSLLKNGAKVRAIHRSQSNMDAVKKVFGYFTTAEEASQLYTKIQWFEASINDIPALTEAFEGVEKVYHCAARIDFEPKNFKQLKKINAEGTANIVNLCLLFLVKKLCYVSSIATLGETLDDSLITEENYYNHDADNSVYAITKHSAEMEVWRGTQEGLDAVIVNPGVIFGSGFWKSGSGIILTIGARGIPVYTLGSIALVDVLDVVQIMIQTMESSITKNRFILVGKNCSYQDLMTQFATAFNNKQPQKAIAKWKLNLASKIDWFLHTFFRTTRKLSKSAINSLYSKKYYSSKKVESTLNFEFTPFKKTLSRVVGDYKSES